MSIFVVGSINMDLVIRAPFMPENGMTISGNGFLKNPGGKGANQAVAAGKLGGDAYMVGCVGEAFGDELTAALHKYKVNTDYVRTVKDVSSGIAVIVIVDSDNRIILDRGANGCVGTGLIDDALKNAGKNDILLCQLEINPDAIEYAMKKAKEIGMTTILNPAPACKLSPAILQSCDYFIPNKSECRFYTGMEINTEDDILKSTEILKKYGIKNIIITLGEKGSVYIGEKGYFKVPCFKVKATDTTAAGDTFVGAFATMLQKGRDIEYAMTYASKAASITVTRKGAQQSIPYENEVEI